MKTWHNRNHLAVLASVTLLMSILLAARFGIELVAECDFPNCRIEIDGRQP